MDYPSTSGNHNDGSNVRIKSRVDSCFVPLCPSTSAKFPNKIFLSGPSAPKLRKKWFQAAKRTDTYSPKTVIRCCEDHFDLEKDVENWIKYKMLGGNLYLKKNVVPHIFECQNRMMPIKPRSAILKRNRREILECIENAPVMEQNSRSSSLDAMDFKVEPECISNEQVHVKEEVVECLKEEAEWEDSAADVASLYAGHEVKDELVLGPEGLQPRDIAFTLFAAQSAVRAQPKLKDCELRLERIDDLEAPLGTDTRRDKGRVGNNADVGHETHSSNDISNEKETYDICKTRFDLKTQLMEHVMIHIHQSTEQEQISVTGNAPSAAGGRGESRGRMSTGERRHCCEICNKNFTKLGSLKRHERIHSGERPFSCRTCTKKFTNLGYFKIHERIHSGEKPFSCRTCNKQFTQPSHLKRHERIHSGEKPFSCRTCNKKFTDSSHLKRHERIHTGEKRYSCDICNKKFTRLENLKEHERIHSGDKPFSCRTCNEKFTHPSQLKRHERIHSRT